MNNYKTLLEDLLDRKLREENILCGSSGVKTIDEYKYSLGRIHTIKEIIKLIETYKNKGIV